MKKAILLLLMGATLFVSCGKDDDDQPAVKTKSEMLIRTWEVSSTVVTLGTLPVPAYTKGSTTPNALDMSKFRFEFKSNGDFVQTGIDGTQVTGKWALSDNDTKLTLTTAALPAPDVWKADNITETNLDISKDIAGNSTAPGDVYWKNLVDTYGKPLGLSSANGVKIAIKTIPVK